MSLVARVNNSLFLRLFLIFSATVLVFFLIITFAIRQIDRNWRAERLSPLPDFYLDNITLIVDNIGVPPDLERATQLSQELSLTIIIRSPHINWQSDDQNDLDISQAVFVRSLSEQAQMMVVGNEDVIRVSRGGYEYYLNRRVPTLSEYDYVVVYVGLAMAALVLLLNFWLVRRLLAPVKQLREGAERICDGDLSYRVKTHRTDELGELTDSVNHMADSLQSMLEAKRQLLLAISHELRTPITRAKLHLEFIEDGSVKEDLGDDINEIDLLISDLIEAERLSNQHQALLAEHVDFADYIGLVLQAYHDYKGGVVFERPDDDVSISIDKLRTRLLLTNIVNNAIRHGRDNPITVRVSFTGSHAVLEVEDLGEGISEEHMEHLSEPFYRADSARQRNTGGFGLGLYLCRLIAQAHGGRLEISSELGVGTHVKVYLPYEQESQEFREDA
ncbi:MAG: HAMP domain-containing histidine kinase [Pseudomonadales bacterium]|nr:HAMP domain-containing histidine kinase [Pseudomonadales bacterium]MCP5357147.1 HAMP domain-containing histidine kinase [Pseudomonadales bacterium]